VRGEREGEIFNKTQTCILLHDLEET
jgi:hypothetical protein